MNINLIYVANIETIVKKNDATNNIDRLHFKVVKYDAFLYFIKNRTFIDIETGKIYSTRHKNKLNKKFINITSLKYLNEHIEEAEIPENISRKHLLSLCKK